MSSQIKLVLIVLLSVSGGPSAIFGVPAASFLPILAYENENLDWNQLLKSSRPTEYMDSGEPETSAYNVLMDGYVDSLLTKLPGSYTINRRFERSVLPENPGLEQDAKLQKELIAKIHLGLRRHVGKTKPL